MNKKRFPKAVMRTADEMRDAGTTTAQTSTLQDNVIEMLPKSDATDEPARPAPIDALTTLRRRKAIALVERYANLSSIGGALPIPLANAAAITAIMVRMVRSLSELYGVPFERNRTRSIVIALMGGALPTGFSTIVTSSATYLVPGLNLVGLAISSVTSGVYARSIGQLYIEHFENGAAVNFNSIIKRR